MAAETTEFIWDDKPEPHTARRREILQKYPHIKELFGYDWSSSVIMIALVVVQLGIAYFFEVNQEGFWGSWWVLLLVAYVIGGVLNHWAAMGIHEASHNLVAKTTWQNRWMAILANIPLIIPAAMTFRRHHMRHHTYMGIEGQDNDLPTRRELRWIVNSTWRKFVWQLFFLLVMGIRGIMVKPNKWETINIAFILVTDICIYYWIGQTACIYLLASTVMGMGLHPVAGHYIHEHFVLRPGQETYSYYGKLNWVTFNVGYHFEHHDFVHIPGRLLPKYREMTKEYYEPLLSHRSWTWVLYNFVANPEVGLGSRIIRSFETFKKGLQKRTEAAV